jgi:hypothetical protein
MINAQIYAKKTTLVYYFHYQNSKKEKRKRHTTNVKGNDILEKYSETTKWPSTEARKA